jgi:hypothetical protein
MECHIDTGTGFDDAFDAAPIGKLAGLVVVVTLVPDVVVDGVPDPHAPRATPAPAMPIS